jgi:hypothetical protein
MALLITLSLITLTTLVWTRYVASTRLVAELAEADHAHQIRISRRSRYAGR